MKRKFPGLLFFLLLLITGAQFSIAQEPKLPPLYFTINAGYGFPNIPAMYYQSQGTGTNSGSYNPIYLEAGYNYSKKGIVSLFLSDAAATTGNFTFLDTAGVSHSYSYYVSLFTLGISTQYHFVIGHHFSPYAGCMLGYCFSNFNDEGLNPGEGAVTVNSTSYVYHVYVGSYYYFNSWWGLDARIGYGNSYYGSVGLTFKIKVNQEAY